MDEMVCFRVDKSLKERMKMLEHINWSAVIRRALNEQLEREHHIDINRARKALAGIKKLREVGSFENGKTSTEIIREWRDKRKF